MTYDEWIAQFNKTGTAPTLRAAWDAATYAMNQEQGIAENEAAKDARRKEVVIAICKLQYPSYGGAPASYAEKVDAIIREAQG